MHRRLAFLIVPLILLLLSAGCGSSGTNSATNSKLSQPKPLVVFIGASITRGWASYADFPGHNWIDMGINGQTSTQVLARFQTDALDQHPAMVHILVGTNDMTYGVPLSTSMANFTQMIGMAQSAGVKVFLGTIPPYGPKPDGTYPSGYYAGRNSDVVTFNTSLTDLANRQGATIIDYHLLLTAPDGGYLTQYTTDGIHPNAAGYSLMTPRAEAALR